MYCRRIARFAVLEAIALCLAVASSAQMLPIDTGKSNVTVHVYKAGLFSAFGDNHEIEARISDGVVDQNGGRVHFVIRAAGLKVLDRELSS